jgi:hypothetical protein
MATALVAALRILVQVPPAMSASWVDADADADADVELSAVAQVVC